MKKQQVLVLTVLLLGVVLCREAQAFFNPSTGRWLSRDPIAEKGGLNINNISKNDILNYYDKWGLKCCLLTYSSIPYDHAALECDGGTYISAFPDDGIVTGPSDVKWSTREKDEKKYGSPSETCFDCLDSTKVADWFKKYQSSGEKFTGLGNNCSDVASQATTDSLSESQRKKPNCPKCPWGIVRYYPVDLLEGGAPSTPKILKKQVEQWVNNDCNRYKGCEAYLPFGR